MKVGTAVETIVVQSEVPAVQLATSDISAVVNATTVRELPLNGRSWTDLAQLQPGVNAIQTQPTFAAGTDRGNRGFGQQLTISGARPQQNNYRLDGVSLNDYANGAPGSVLGGNLGVDAIQEFSVLTSNYSAEYGKTSGGVVNAITRSGTNQFHGSAYEFLRNSALDARNFFDGAKVPPFKRNQFGGALGGPIRKDKTFIFGDYESVRQSLGLTRVNTVLSPAARAGNLAAGSVTVDPLVQKYLAMEPLPNAGLRGNGDTGIFAFAGQQIVNENFVTARADQRISDKDSLFGTYSFDNSPLTQPDTLGNVLQHAIARRQIVSLEESRIFSPTFVNTVRLGYNRAHTTSAGGVQAINPAAADTSLGWAPGLTATYAQVTGLTLIGPGVAPPIYQFIWNAYQVYDDAFLTRGLHSLKFGFGFERNQLNQVTNTADYLGRFFFGNLRSFLTNAPSRVRGVIPSLATPRGMRLNIVGAYVQDDWRMRPNLTVNVGLRYEFSTGPTENQGKLTNLLNISDAQPHLGDPYISNPTRRNFEPRVGFAWDPFRNGKTAVRGGFGIFDALPLPYELILNNTSSAPWRTTLATMGSAVLASPPSVAAGTATTAQGEWPHVVPSLTNVRLTNPINRAWRYVDNNIKRNYVYQYNLNIQRQITSNTTLLFGYTGSRGIHNPFQADSVNTVLPTKAAGGDYYWPSPWSGSLPGTGAVSQAARLLNPTTMAIMYNTMWMSRSWYNAFQGRLNKQMSHGFQVQGSFTYSKSIDDASGSTAGDTFQLDAVSEPWYDLKLDKGLSAFDVRRNLVVNSLWNAPTPKSLGGFAERVLGGWQLGLITSLADGVPATPQIGSDMLGEVITTVNSGNLVPGCSWRDLINSNYRHSLFYVNPNCISLVPKTTDNAPFCDSAGRGFSAALAANSCANILGNIGRNTFIGHGLFNVDFSLFMNNGIPR